MRVEIGFNFFFTRHRQLKEEMPSHQKRFADTEKLDALMRKMCGEGVGGALQSLRSKWDSLDVLIESHQEVIKSQVKTELDAMKTIFLSKLIFVFLFLCFSFLFLCFIFCSYIV